MKLQTIGNLIGAAALTVLILVIAAILAYFAIIIIVICIMMLWGVAAMALSMAGVYIFPLTENASVEWLFHLLISPFNPPSNTGRYEFLHIQMVLVFFVSAGLFFAFFISERRRILALIYNPLGHIASRIEQAAAFRFTNQFDLQRVESHRSSCLLITSVRVRKGRRRVFRSLFDYRGYAQSLLGFAPSLSEEMRKETDKALKRTARTLLISLISIYMFFFCVMVLVAYETGNTFNPEEARIFVIDSMLRGALFDLMESFDIGTSMQYSSGFLLSSVEFTIRCITSVLIIAYLIGSARLLIGRPFKSKVFSIAGNEIGQAVLCIMLLETCSKRLERYRVNDPPGKFFDRSYSVKIFDEAAFRRVSSIVSRRLSLIVETARRPLLD